MGQIDRILAKGRGLKIPPKVKKQPSFTHNLDPIQDNKIDAQNRQRIANDPSRIATNQDTAEGNTVPKNAETTGISAATLITEVHSSRDFQLTYSNLIKLLGLGNGKIKITDHVADEYLFINYNEFHLEDKADKVISDNDVNKADDKRPV